MRTNPSDPYGKVLIVTGANADDAVVAAQAVALHSDMLSGGQDGHRKSHTARQAGAGRRPALGTH